MKKTIGSLGLILAVLIGGIVACSETKKNSGENGTDGNEGTETQSTDGNEGTETQSTDGNETEVGEFLKSDKSRNMNPEPEDDVLARLVESNTEFALDMYAQLRKDNEDNLFFSPFSLSAGLAMTYGGADGTTETQMANTLHFASFEQEKLHEAFNRLLLDLESRAEPETENDSGFQLEIFDSFWGQSGFPFLSEYLDLLSVNYGAGIRTMDFQNDLTASIDAVNDWIAESTQGKIENVLDAGDITLPIYSILVNAIYFKAAWNLPFKEGNTSEKKFTLLSGETETVDMMAQYEHFSYGEGEGYNVVSLPYDGGQLDMVIIAPDSGTFASFEESLDSSKVESILQNMSRPSLTWVTMNVPKFDISSKWNMEDMLKSLGMEDPFTSDADFSGISEEFLRIKKIIHQTDISVDEAGTEAAAATVIVDSNGDADYVDFILDRPFIFLIRDIPTQTILFMGRVTNPAL